MSVQVSASRDSLLMPIGTSGDGTLQRARDFVIRISGALSLRSTTSAEPPREGLTGPVSAEQTSTGVAEATSTQAAIAELRRRSGLTWDQLARLFGVARRSVHFWASGKPLNATNEERLGRFLSVIRSIDRGTARETRAALMTALSDGTIPFDLLAADRFGEALVRLGLGTQSAIPSLPPLSAAARASRVPVSPEDRVGALHDPVHHDVGRARAAKSVRIKNER